MITVTLTTPCYRYAMEMAGVRHWHAKARSKRDRRGASSLASRGIHEVGCLGEVIAMNACGIPEPTLTLDTFKSEPDIAPGLTPSFPDGAEVRTRTADWHDLIIYEDDDPNMPYILVLLNETRDGGTVAGWIKGKDAMDRAEWFKDPNGRGAAWFVPQSELTSIGDVQ